MATTKAMTERQELIMELVAHVKNGNEYEVCQKKPNTMVEVYVTYNGTYYTDFDFAKVQYPDEWDAEHGIDLAIRKACAAIAKRILNNI